MATDNQKKGVVAAAALTVIALTTWEGMDLTAKRYRHDPPGVITACVGMTNFDRKLRVGQKFTEEECKAYLLQDIPRYAAAVNKCIPVDMPPHRRAALNSFAYNVGAGNLCRSSVAKHIKAGRIEEGCDALMLYVRANGKYLRGLENRRRWERNWCLRDD